MISINAEISKESLLSKRANELAINLIVKNTGNNVVKIRRITSMLPNNVNTELLIDKQQKSNLELANDIYKQLEVLTNYNILNLEASKELWVKHAEGFFKELTKNLHHLIVKLYFAPLAFKTLMRRYTYRLQSLEVDINNLNDAQWAFDNYIKKSDDVKLIILFESKLRQLIDMRLENNGSETIAEIGPSESFTRTFVFRFRRSNWEERIYSLNFEVGFLASDGVHEQNKEASCSFPVIISPRPFLLTVLAAIFSLLGVILKVSITDKNFYTPNDFFTGIYATLRTQEGIGAIILAIVFFNIYEHTDVGKKIAVNINWRASLLIGILSGMFGDRIIEAMKVIIGAN